MRDFHQKMNDGLYEELYDGADSGFTKTGSAEEITKFLDAVHKKLGNAGESTLQNIRVNATTSGTFLITQHQTTFERGSAIETFTWRKVDGHLQLYGYHVESKALILN